jgi:hypothetical protein
LNNNHSIPNLAESSGKEIAQAFIRANMSRNFEEKAKTELSSLYRHMMNEGKHLAAAAVASAISALESRCAGLNPGLKNDSLQALSVLRTSATHTASQYIERIHHDPDQPVMDIYLHSGMKMTVSCSKFNAALFDASWGPGRCGHNLNFAFNIDEVAVLSIISR